MRITPKSPELLQAQLAAFTDTTIEQPEHREYTHQHLSTIAEGAVKAITYTTYELPQEMGVMNLPELKLHHVASVDAYHSYMQEVGGRHHVDIDKRHTMLSAYPRYRSGVEEIMRHTATKFDDPRSHPNYIASGSFAHAYRMDYDEHAMVVRVPRKQTAANATDARIIGLMRGIGISGLEQGIAASYEKGVTISEYMHGQPVGSLSTDNRHAISPAHVSQLHETVYRAYEAGIFIDTSNAGNFFYDSGLGFGIIDYAGTQTEADEPVTPEEAIAKLSAVIVENWQWQDKRAEKPIQDYARIFER